MKTCIICIYKYVCSNPASLISLLLNYSNKLPLPFGLITSPSVRPTATPTADAQCSFHHTHTDTHVSR